MPGTAAHREEAMATQQLSILCPVHNEERAIPLFFERIRPVLYKLSEHYVVHLIFLNNASTDQSSQQILKIREFWPATYVITISRDVGYHASLECGLRNTSGDLFVLIDVDCEDPPEMILDFIEKYEQGYDIVYGERVDREESAVIKSARKFFYRLLHALADEEIILDMAEFSLITNEVRAAVLAENSSFPFLRAAIARVGYRRAALPFKRRKRVVGDTHYNLFRMTIFAVAGILSSSTLFLRLPIYFLPLWLLTLLVLGMRYISTGSQWYAVSGCLIFAAYVGATLAFTALYVARTYKNGLHRPNAFIDHSRSIFQFGDEGALNTEKSGAHATPGVAKR
jgi:dolichol-phosphate mannosyltransferase